MKGIKDAKNLITHSGHILIASPDSPDGDSVSSNLALALALAALGKKVTLAASDPIPHELSWMLEKDEEFLLPEDLNAISRKPDLVIITDIGGISQISKLTRRVPWILDLPTLLIDHHANRDDYKTTASIIDPEAAATGELLLEIFPKLGLEITPRIAGLMYEGIAADTASFTNLNTDWQVLAAASKLAKLGAEPYHLHQGFVAATAMDTARFSILAKLMSKVVFRGPIAYGLIKFDDVSELGPNPGMSSLLNAMIRNLKGVKVSFVLGEKEDKTLRLSMRSHPGIDVAKVCGVFGGGGHTVAAGALVKDHTLEEAANIVVSELEKQL